MVTEVHILWSPERGSCNQCGVIHERVRRFTALGSCTVFCIHCWDGFVSDECKIPSRQWKRDISNNWNKNMSMCLEYDDGVTRGPLN